MKHPLLQADEFRNQPLRLVGFNAVNGGIIKLIENGDTGAV